MKLSIITINKNNAKGLETTIQSVAGQTFTDYEYIVIDGASTDGSVDVIKKYSGHITYWVSEPDSGIYNAMNKGIKQAKGEYCLFLNSGDFLAGPEILITAFKGIAQLGDAGIYYSGCMTTEGKRFRPPESVNINYFIAQNLNHQNTLIRRSIFLEHGFYDERYRIAADYQFWLRECWLHKTVFRYISTGISTYEADGISAKADFDSEMDEAIRSVLPEFAESLVKLRRYSHSIYGSIVEELDGPSGFLNFCLKCYRFIKRKTAKPRNGYDAGNRQ